jgi:hypothetical protein
MEFSTFLRNKVSYIIPNKMITGFLVILVDIGYNDMPSTLKVINNC